MEAFSKQTLNSFATEPPINTAVDDNQMTMSQFEPFAALAHQHTDALGQQAKKAMQAQKK